MIRASRDWSGAPIERNWPLPVLLALALCVRLFAVFAFPSLHHPDEAFQLFEPAHRLAFGWGVKTWEFDAGIRSLVAPGLLAGVFRLATPIVGGPEGYIDTARICVALLSLLPIHFVFQAGGRESRTHAFVAGFVAAVWFEMVYFSFRPLTEAVACDFALTALALASPPNRKMSRRTAAGLGLCLALTAFLRLQLAPGAALIALATCRLEVRRRWLPLAAGALPVLIVFGAVDWWAWGAPFVSYFRAVAVNLGADKASVFGVEARYWYFNVIAAVWGPFLPAAIVLCGLRLRRSWLWIGFAAVELAVHSAIPHKEYRFVFPAMAALVVAAALGSADLAVRFGPRLRGVRPGFLTAVVMSAWLVTSATLSAAPQFRDQWMVSRGEIESEYWLASRPDLCGALFYDSAWFATGGYAFLHRRVPLYFPVYAMTRGPGNRLLWPADMGLRRRAASDAEGAYNYVVLSPGSLHIFQPTYRLARCSDDGVCVAERQGGCSANASLSPILAHVGLGEPMRRP